MRLRRVEDDEEPKPKKKKKKRKGTPASEESNYGDGLGAGFDFVMGVGFVLLGLFMLGGALYSLTNKNSDRIYVGGFIVGPLFIFRGFRKMSGDES